jgi:hypothetical protein
MLSLKDLLPSVLSFALLLVSLRLEMILAAPFTIVLIYLVRLQLVSWNGHDWNRFNPLKRRRIGPSYALDFYGV